MPLVRPDQNFPVQMGRALRVLGMSHQEMGELLTASRKTVGRWVGGRAEPGQHQLAKLVQVLYPKDPVLATELAGQMGVTIADHGPKAAPSAPGPAAVAPSPPRPFPPIPLLAESVVCAAIEVLRVEPQVARDVLRAAIGRARAMGLTLEELDDALTPKGAGAGAAQVRAVQRKGRTKVAEA